MFSSRSPLPHLRRTISKPPPTIPKRHIADSVPTQAKALVFSEYGPPKDVLKLHTHPFFPAYNSRIAIKFLASPINPSDINQIEGTYPSKPTFTKSLDSSTPLTVSGNEGFAQVLAVGPLVQGFAPGDRVIMNVPSFGTWRTHASAKASDLLKLSPKHAEVITPLQAATVSVNPCTAYRMLKDFVPLRRGDWFVQNAANSGVGRAVIQLAKMWGFKSVNIVRQRPGGVEALREELKRLGGDEVVTDEELAQEDVKEWLRTMVDGDGSGGIKLGLNCVGGRQVNDLCKLLGNGGHLVTYGAMSKKPLTIPASYFIFRDLHFHGFWATPWSAKHPKEKKEMVDKILGYISSGKLKDVPFQVTPWRSDTTEEELKAAVERTGKEFSGKKQVFVFED